MKNLQKIVLAFLLLTQSAYALDNKELHRLGSYLSYVVAGSDEILGEDDTKKLWTVGADCPECDGVGKVGDGTVMLKCEWSDGDYFCNGGKIAKLGDMEEMFETLEASGGFTEEPPAQSTCPTDCPDCPTCVQPTQEEQPAEPQLSEKCITELNQTRWNWQGVTNVPTSVMRSHLIEEHQISPESVDRMKREELIALHNLLHNEEVRASDPAAKSSRSSSSCPSGNCPTSGSRSSSSSRGWGLFRRR